MHLGGNADFDGTESSTLLSEYWPERIGSVISPLCKFILEQIERHDIGKETLSEVIPVGTCKRCGNFFVIGRGGAKTILRQQLPSRISSGPNDTGTKSGANAKVPRKGKGN
jgi:hypothetical protein